MLLNMTKANILLLNLKLDKLKLFLNLLETEVRFNRTCRIHNSLGHNSLHHPVKMKCMLILSDPTSIMVGIKNQ